MALVSACLPLFHCKVALVKPIFLDSDSVSGLRLSEETQSGTDISPYQRCKLTFVFLQIILDTLHRDMRLQDEDSLTSISSGLETGVPLTKVGITFKGCLTMEKREIAVKATDTVNSRWAMKMKLILSSVIVLNEEH